MNIQEMHIMFRQFAQQMGLQNVRAILPEQIDLLLNTSIGDTINAIIKQNIGITNDRVITDNSKIGQINDLKGLYTIDEYNCINAHPKYDLKATYTYTNQNRDSVRCTIEELINLCGNNKYTDDEIENANKYDKTSAYYSKVDPGELFMVTTGKNSGIYNCVDTEDQSVYDLYRGAIGEDSLTAGWCDLVCSIPEGNYEIGYFKHKKSNDFNGRLVGSIPINPLYYVDFSLNYIQGTGDISDTVQFNKDISFTTNYYPVRLIDSAFLSDTLNDFILKNRLRSPVLVIYNNNNNLLFDLYIDKITNGLLPENLIPYKFKCEYIAKPAIVKYAEDINGTNVDCNLPEHLHIDVVKRAVELYQASVSGNIQSAQSREQQQRREMVRNQAQPSPYGAQNDSQQ